jgi:hypothetical protein
VLTSASSRIKKHIYIFFPIVNNFKEIRATGFQPVYRCEYPVKKNDNRHHPSKYVHKRLFPVVTLFFDLPNRSPIIIKKKLMKNKRNSLVDKIEVVVLYFRTENAPRSVE